MDYSYGSSAYDPSYQSVGSPPPVIRIYTYGIEVISPPDPGMSSLARINCTTIPAPPQDLCAAYTGLDVPIQEYVYADPVFQDKLRRASEAISEKALSRGSAYYGDMAAVAVYCRAGIHRSVVMAIALRDVLEGEYGLRCQVKHLTLGIGLEKRRARRAMEEYGLDDSY